MIRILHTIDTTGPGGAETVFVNLVKGLDRQEFESVVAIRGPGWVCDELGKNGVSPLFINSKGSFSVSYLSELVEIIHRDKIDLVQSHLLGSNLYCSLAGMICRVPVVSTFHGFVDINVKEQFSAIKSIIINQGSAKIVFVSDNLRKFYIKQKGFSGRKSVTINNGIDTSLFKPQRDNSIRKKFGIGPDNILVGAVGNIRPAKGYEYLLETAKLIIDRYPQYRFIVAGEGSGMLFDCIMNLRKKLGLEKHFFFLGFEPDVPRFLNNLDIFVLSSVSEGFSISTIEAMACGIPVVATRSGGPEEIINHLENGILVEAGSSSQLAAGLLKLHIESRLCNKIKNTSLGIANDKYNLNIIIKQYQRQYKQLLSCD